MENSTSSAHVGEPKGRKHHRKSRTGCSRCKHRKIKCDELKPQCTNCIKHSVKCDFLSHPSPTFNSPAGLSAAEHSSSSYSVYRNGLNPQGTLGSSTLNLLDLELLHNFSTSTCYTLISDPALKTLWRIEVPKIGFSHEFVMHGILALSALHLAYYQPARRDFLISQASLHHQAGLSVASLMVAHVTENNCSALYIFTLMTCVYSLSVSRNSNDLISGEPSESGVAEWLMLVRGTRSIMDSSVPSLVSGPLGPMLIEGYRKIQKMNTEGREASSAQRVLQDLRNVIQRSTTDQQNLEVYMGAIEELQKSFTIVYKGPHQTLETGDVFMFLFLVSQDYLVLLRQQTQEALAIFAFFCAIAKQLEKFWWSEGWSMGLLSSVYELLDKEHRLWVRWAVEEVGWVPPNNS